MKTLYLVYEDGDFVGVSDTEEGVERIKDEKLDGYCQEYIESHEIDFEVKEIYADLKECLNALHVD